MVVVIDIPLHMIEVMSNDTIEDMVEEEEEEEVVAVTIVLHLFTGRRGEKGNRPGTAQGTPTDTTHGADRDHHHSQHITMIEGVVLMDMMTGTYTMSFSFTLSL